MGIEESTLSKNIQKMEDFDFKYHYNGHVVDALNDVRGGQHLRYINDLYRTKKVCLAAVKYECRHNNRGNDIHHVPAAIIDYVVNSMEKKTIKDNTGKKTSEKKYSSYCIEYLRKVATEKKKRALEKGYYGDEFSNYEEVLASCGAKDHEDMLFIRYIEVIKREKGWDKQEEEESKNSLVKEEGASTRRDLQQSCSEIIDIKKEELLERKCSDNITPEAKENMALEKSLNENALVLEVNL